VAKKVCYEQQFHPIPEKLTEKREVADSADGFGVFKGASSRVYY
jgi:hypothetical protein